MDLNWGEAVASSDSWFGKLDGVLLVLETRSATPLIIKRGSLFSKEIYVPADRLVKWDKEGIYLNRSTAELLNHMEVRDIEHEEFIIVLNSRTEVHLEGGKTIHLNGLRLDDERYQVTHLIVSGGAMEERLLLPMSRVAEITSGKIAVAISAEDLGALPAYRRDHDIEADLWEALYDDEDISDTDLKGIHVSVKDSVATFQGNVRNPSASEDIAALAQYVEGVESVNSQLHDDWSLELAIASYITEHAHNLAESVSVHSQQGIVTLTSRLPPEETLDSIIEGIRSIDGVRDINDGSTDSEEVTQSDSVPDGEPEPFPGLFGSE